MLPGSPLFFNLRCFLLRQNKLALSKAVIDIHDFQNELGYICFNISLEINYGSSKIKMRLILQSSFFGGAPIIVRGVMEFLTRGSKITDKMYELEGFFGF